MNILPPRDKSAEDAAFVQYTKWKTEEIAKRKTVTPRETPAPAPEEPKSER